MNNKEQLNLNSDLLNKLQNYYNQIETTRGNLFSWLWYSEFSDNDKVFIAHKAYFWNKIPTQKEITEKLTKADEIIHKIQNIKEQIE